MDSLFSSSIQACLEVIAEHFSYLFDEYGYHVVYIEDPPEPHWLIILESKDCRIRFEHHMGMPEVAVGRPTAPLEWGISIENIEWFSLGRVLDYLQGIEISGSEESAVISDEISFLPPRLQITALSLEGRIREQFADLARRAQPECARLISLIQEDPRAEAWRAFIDFYLQSYPRLHASD